MLGYRELREEQEAARAAGQADRHRHGLVHRGRRRRAAQGLRHPGPEDERRRRAPRPPDGQGHPEDQLQTQGQGHETTFAQIVAERAGDPARGHQGHARRHGQHAVRPGHVRVALHAHRRARPRPWSRGRSARRRGSSPRTCWRWPRTTSSTRRAVLRQGRAGPGQDDPGRGLRRVHELPRRLEAGPGGRPLLRPAEPDLPVRHLPGRRSRSTPTRASGRSTAWSRSTTAASGSTR